MAGRPTVADTDSTIGRRIRVLFVLGGVGSAAWLPFFTALLADRGIPPDRIGLILAAAALAGALAAPAWSHEADTRLGPARALAYACLASAACAFLQSFTGADPLLVGLVAMAMAAAWGPAAGLSDSVALGGLGPERTSSYGRIRAYASGGWAVAVFAFGALYQDVDLWLMIPTFMLAQTVTSGYAASFGRPSVVEHDGSDRSRFASVRAAFRAAPRLGPFLAGLLLFSLAGSAVDGFVPLQMLGEGGGPFLIGIAAGLAAVLEIPFFVGSERLAARLGMRTLLAAGLAIGTAVLVAWALVDSPRAVATIRIVAGAGFGLKYVATVVLTDRIVPSHLRSTGQALLQLSMWSVGPIAGPAVGGFVYQHIGPSALFAGAGAVAAVGSVLAWWAMRGVEASAPEATAA
jgi:PPP family 3-phenylpropionic acid transporter